MADKPESKPKPEMVTLALNAAAGVDVLGEGTPPLLWVGVERDFTTAEAKALLALTNRHGTPLVRTVKRGKK